MSRTFLLAILLSLAMASAQMAYRPQVHTTHVELLSPWSGPGSAQLNPAALSETGRAYGHLGFSLIEGRAGYPVFQFAGDLPVGFAAGFGGFWTTSRIDNSNTVFLEDILVPSLAFAWPLEPGGGYRLAVGAAYPIHHFNAFGAVENHDAGLDLGLRYSFRPHDGLGWFRVGMVFERISRPSVELPDGRGRYYIPRQNNLSLAWSSPADRFEGHLEFFRVFGPETDESPRLLHWRINDVKTWGIQFAPIPWLAFKVETPFFSWLATYGVVTKLAPLLGYPIRIETNLGMTDRIFPLVPEKIWGDGDAGDDRGLFLTLTVGAEL